MFQSGQAEPLKLAVHGSMGLLAALCCGYNAVAFALRREGHLAVNVALYGTLVALEARKVQHHRESCERSTA
jgi:hypothetical protein